ncbi:MAG TPA: Rne/Rng family ribonuclease, partial [Sporichthya sp.]|nr:Rne/Rng family ribonuclease [Sporichthya sp.]
MLENDEPTGTADTGVADQNTITTAAPAPRRRRAAGRPAGPPEAAAAPETGPETAPAAEPGPEAAAEPAAEEKPKAKRTRKKAAPAAKAASADAPDPAADAAADAAADPAADAPVEKPKAKRTRKKAEPPVEVEVAAEAKPELDAAAADAAEELTEEEAALAAAADGAPVPPTMLLFQAPEPDAVPRRRSRRRVAEIADDLDAIVEEAPEEDVEAIEDALADAESDDDDERGPARRRRRRGGRGRRGRGGRAGEGGAEDGEDDDAPEDSAEEPGAEDDADSAGEAGTRRRRRRRRRADGEDGASPDDPEITVTRVRSSRSASNRGSDRGPDRGPDRGDDEVTSVRGSTRLEAKKQRRREGREAGRRRVPIITEAEFLARRESVERVMVVRQGKERTQIAVLEDGVLVEHYVNKVDSTSLMGNVFLGRVQNVLPSMEAAFVDIGKGRNAVLYAGEVNFEGLEGQPKRIEHALKSGQSVLVQVTKDPLGHKGARLTSQISLPGRYLVYVPEGSMTGISRKLPDTERSRLKAILKKVVPENAGVIIRTAAEGASEEELSRDVQQLAAQWATIQKKAKTATAPALLLGEPDLTIRVVRDIFNSDFTSLVVGGDDAWTEVSEYVDSAAPDLRDRVSKWTGEQDVFAAHRVDEQILKALDRKVWLPSGGSLVIDRTEAMTVVDVNTGKFTGQGGNLEETVTRNNLEAAEEIVRQLRLRDIGGIIVVDFIDMVLESNRELVLRRLVECLGRDRTKHQVAEVTSLGLVQMTRKRIGQGLLEAFSHTCEHCNGRGIVVRTDQPDRAPAIPKPGPPVGSRAADADAPAAGGSRSARRR